MLPEQRKGQLRELLGVFLLAFALFYAISLWSYHSIDPSINTVTPQGKVHNYGGLVGSYLADISLQIWGAASVWFILLSFLAALYCFRGRLPEHPLRGGIGYLLLIIATSSGFSLTWKELPYGGGLLQPGGALGQFVAENLSYYFNTIGAFIAVAWCFTTGFLLTTALSLTEGWEVASLMLSRQGGRMQRLREWLRARKSRKESTPFVSATVSYETPFDPTYATSSPTILSNSMTLSPHDLVPMLDEEGNFAIPNEIPSSLAERPAAAAAAPQSSLLERLRKKWKKKSLTPPSDSTSASPSPHTPTKPVSWAEASPSSFASLAERLAARKANLKEKALSLPIRSGLKFLAQKENELAVKKKSPLSQIVDFSLPSLEFLKDPPAGAEAFDQNDHQELALKLQQTLQEFGVKGQIVAIQPGPVITMYEFEPAPGIKINKISILENDLALALSAIHVRIVAPIPGKSVVGFEIPNAKRAHVYLKELIANERFASFDGILPLALGKDIAGQPVIADIAKMPHLLIAGATGSGKSVFVNALICCLLYRFTPAQLRFLMIDPKMLEFTAYEGIPNLLMPVITDAKRASLALQWIVREMENRYDTMSKVGARNIDIYNKVIQEKAARAARLQKRDFVPAEKLPYLLIVIDELADLMMVASKDVEVSITRLAQMARAAGIHMVVATQRPSVDVITGIIKANFPARISFQVSSKIDSRTILDTSGAESLLGFGDMLFLPPGTSKLQRIHGAYVADGEINKIVKHLSEQGSPLYDTELLDDLVDKREKEEVFDDINDELYDQALDIVARTRQASISMIQRRFRIGYNRAARLIERMEEEGVVSTADGSKPRKVLVSSLDV